MFKFGNKWDDYLGEEFTKPYYLKLRGFLKEEYFSRTIYPDMYDIFNAFLYTPYDEVKAVILGQDPYHGEGQAHGLSFSVKEGIVPPPSLVNIFKELYTDIGIKRPMSGSLEKWAKSGVLLLNTVLTVRKDLANSHKGRGWEIFTDKAIEALNLSEKPIVFILWGANARSKKSLITNPIHKIIESVHPSPLSASGGFFGSRPFSRANEYLSAFGREIDWSL